jgi:hypothetical protein
MLTEDVKKEESAIATHAVLMALERVPMNKTRLFQAVWRNCSRRIARHAEDGEACPVVFLDSLAMLQAGGLIMRTAHPLEARRVYYLTEKGSDMVKGEVKRSGTSLRRRSSRTRA